MLSNTGSASVVMMSSTVPKTGLYQSIRWRLHPEVDFGQSDRAWMYYLDQA